MQTRSNLGAQANNLRVFLAGVCASAISEMAERAMTSPTTVAPIEYDDSIHGLLITTASGTVIRAVFTVEHVGEGPSKAGF